jgi:hypothetical protein
MENGLASGRGGTEQDTAGAADHILAQAWLNYHSLAAGGDAKFAKDLRR